MTEQPTRKCELCDVSLEYDGDGKQLVFPACPRCGA